MPDGSIWLFNSLEAPLDKRRAVCQNARPSPWAVGSSTRTLSQIGSSSTCAIDVRACFPDLQGRLSGCGSVTRGRADRLIFRGGEQTGHARSSRHAFAGTEANPDRHFYNPGGSYDPPGTPSSMAFAGARLDSGFFA